MKVFVVYPRPFSDRLDEHSDPYALAVTPGYPQTCHGHGVLDSEDRSPWALSFGRLSASAPQQYRSRDA